MEGITEEGKSVGFVFDLSLRHTDAGVRNIDVIKEQLTEFVKLNFEDGYDSMYLYHPLMIAPTYSIGDHNSWIGNYETDGWLFNLEKATKQTLFVIAAEDNDFRKYLVLITDRLHNTDFLDKLLYLNEKDHLQINLVVIGVGKHYNQELLKHYEGKATHLHIDNPSDLISKLIQKDTSSDKQNVCSPTDE